jgi:hypothetical protein
MVAPHALGCRGTCRGSVEKGLNKIVAGRQGEQEIFGCNLTGGGLPNAPKRPH